MGSRESVAFGEENRVAGAGRPGGGRHRQVWTPSGCDHDLCRAGAEEPVAQRRDRGRGCRGGAAFDTGHRAAVGRRHVADREGRGAAGLGRALGVERLERFRARLGQGRRCRRSGSAPGPGRTSGPRRRSPRPSRPRRPASPPRAAARGVVEGNTASATAAALAAGSEPPTRVVLPVAKPGKPSCSTVCAGGASVASFSTTGAGDGAGAASGSSLGAAAAADHGGDDEDDRDRDERRDSLDRAGDRAALAFRRRRLRIGFRLPPSCPPARARVGGPRTASRTATRRR